MHSAPRSVKRGCRWPVCSILCHYAMFVRFRQSVERLQLSIVETRRVAGKVRHEHIASLGSISATLSIADRIEFWARLHERLGRLSNRIDAEALGRLLGSVHERIPMPTIAEQRALQLENAQADARFWEGVQDMNATTVAEYKELVGGIEGTISKGEKAAAYAGERAAAAKDWIARIEKGETVPGGLGRPLTSKDLIPAGWSQSDVRHALRLAALGDFAGAFEEYLARIDEHTQRHGRRFAKRTSAAILRRQLGLSRDKPR
jgi:hypothetical protein